MLLPEDEAWEGMSEEEAASELRSLNKGRFIFNYAYYLHLCISCVHFLQVEEVVGASGHNTLAMGKKVGRKAVSKMIRCL